MSSVHLAEKDVLQRKRKIIKLVAPLVKDRNHIDVKQVAGANFTLAVVNRGGQDTSSTPPDMIRVETKVDRIHFNYYEIWKPLAKEQNLFLERSYMHLYRKPAQSLDENQVLCLHCDPLLKNSDIFYHYKRSPHLHIMGAAPNIDRAHLSVCLHKADDGMKDIETLMELMASSIMMISREVFPSYERYGYVV